jgi:hypothetical protein
LARRPVGVVALAGWCVVALARRPVGVVALAWWLVGVVRLAGWCVVALARRPVGVVALAWWLVVALAWWLVGAVRLARRSVGVVRRAGTVRWSLSLRRSVLSRRRHGQELGGVRGHIGRRLVPGLRRARCERVGCGRRSGVRGARGSLAIRLRDGVGRSRFVGRARRADRWLQNRRGRVRQGSNDRPVRRSAGHVQGSSRRPDLRLLLRRRIHAARRHCGSGCFPAGGVDRGRLPYPADRARNCGDRWADESRGLRRDDRIDPDRRRRKRGRSRGEQRERQDDRGSSGDRDRRRPALEDSSEDGRNRQEDWCLAAHVAEAPGDGLPGSME